uniref:Uncharacterized protein n=1 Tax=Glossina pallidipes TaxID=7398 RepID=A0A1A9Z2M5_GLOPL
MKQIIPTTTATTTTTTKTFTFYATLSSVNVCDRLLVAAVDIVFVSFNVTLVADKLDYLMALWVVFWVQKFHLCGFLRRDIIDDRLAGWLAGWFVGWLVGCYCIKLTDSLTY